ncbi:MAG: trypsin-like serine protease [Clostridiales bacterium]|nr:trypsin-like serine protease [Clostridiales bacterium]
MGNRKSIAIIVAACILLSFVCGFGGAFAANALDDYMDKKAEIREAQETGDVSIGDNNRIATAVNLAEATGSNLTISEIVALNENAVVEIRTEMIATDSWMMQYVTEGAGSGVIVSKEGYIATNNHVIDGARKIAVRLKNGTEYEATLVGRDSETDIAVLKIDADGLTCAVFGDSDRLVVGELAVAIGNPLGKLGGTATAGIISAKDRQITIDGKDMTLLQTDASINPGNSGGGLFNQNGELIGIVVAKSTGSDVEGLGFAIPINTAEPVIEELIDHGYVKGRPDVGMTFRDFTSITDAFFYGVRNLGIYVDEVYGEEAIEAGFRENDMICYVDDAEIRSANDLTEAFKGCKPGDVREIVILRDGRQMTLSLVIGEKTN